MRTNRQKQNPSPLLGEIFNLDQEGRHPERGIFANGATELYARAFQLIHLISTGTTDRGTHRDHKYAAA